MSRSTITCHTALPHVTRHYHMSHGTTAFLTTTSHFTRHYCISRSTIAFLMAHPHSHGTTAFLMVHPHSHGTTVFTRRYRISRRTAQSISKFNANHKIQGGYQNSAPYCHNKRHSDSHSFTFAGTVPTKDSAVYGHLCGHLRGLSPRRVSGFMMSAGTFAGTVPTGVHRGSCVGLA